MNTENINMISVHTKLGALEERTNNFEKRLDGVEDSIDQRLKDIDFKITQNNLMAETKLEKVDEKVDQILSLHSELRGSWKMTTFLATVFLTLCGAAAWFIDKFEIFNNVGV